MRRTTSYASRISTSFEGRSPFCDSEVARRLANTILDGRCLWDHVFQGGKRMGDRGHEMTRDVDYLMNIWGCFGWSNSAQLSRQ